MSTTDIAADADRASHPSRTVRRTVAGAVLISMVAGSLVAAALPSVVVVPAAAAADATAAAEPKRLEGEKFTSGTNPNGEDLKRESINLGNTFNGTVVRFDDVNFADSMATLTVRASTRDDAIGANPRLEFFIDEAITANKIADVAVPTTGGWGNWRNTTVDLNAPVDGLHDVIIVMHVDDIPGRRNYVANFDYFEFGPAVTGTPVTKISDLLLGVGATETERNLVWYSNADVPQGAELVEKSEIVNGVFPATAEEFSVTAGGPTTSGEYFRDVTLSGLEENTEYAYRVGDDATGWSPVYTFRTQSFTGGFDFLFFGDPQVGASGNLANDEAGWIDTLNVASQSYPNAEMIFSAGDQVESAGNENEYDTLLKPAQLRSIPFVATNGNHDVGSKAYEQHYNVPNEDLSAGGAAGGSSSGGDYWFIHKDVLFLNINSNSRDFASHNAFLEKVVAEQGDKVKWKVLAFHHSIYSAAVHATDGDIIDRRNNMPQKISELGIDVVLMGHDHHYTRSYLIKDGVLAHPDEQAAAEEVVAGPGEVLYVTANSSSGSKYYNLNTGIDLWWSSVRNQERVRNYSAIEVTDESITVRTLRSQANGASNPVNSVVDEVVLSKAEQAADLNVTATAATRVVAGKQYVTATVTNNEAVPVDVEITTPYGAKSFAAVKPGKSASASINSRLQAIPAGEIAAKVTGVVGDETVTVTKSASYPAAG